MGRAIARRRSEAAQASPTSRPSRSTVDVSANLLTDADSKSRAGTGGAIDVTAINPRTRALGLVTLEVGKQADVLILETPDYRHLAYRVGENLVETVIKRGQIVAA